MSAAHSQIADKLNEKYIAFRDSRNDSGERRRIEAFAWACAEAWPEILSALRSDSAPTEAQARERISQAESWNPKPTESASAQRCVEGEISELARHWAAVDFEKAKLRGWPTDCIHLAREVLRLSAAAPNRTKEKT